jgi:microcystin-dependent protein
VSTPIARTLSGGESEALTETEAKAVAKLLSDPSYFPMEFRAWIKNYIESSDITLPASAISGIGGPSASGRTNLPPGMIVVYAGSEFGPDVLPCNGAAISRTDYDKLFDAIGVDWGPGDGSSTFNVPDFRDRALYGAGSIVALAATDGKALGVRGGPFHHHSINLASENTGSHKHPANNGQFVVTAGTGLFGAGSGIDMGIQTNSGSAGGHQHTVAGDTSGGYDTSPGYAGVNLCITTGKGSG